MIDFFSFDLLSFRDLLDLGNTLRRSDAYDDLWTKDESMSMRESETDDRWKTFFRVESTLCLTGKEVCVKRNSDKR